MIENLISETYNEKIVLDNLRVYLSKLNQDELDEFKSKIIPFIANFALKIEHLFDKTKIKILT